MKILVTGGAGFIGSNYIRYVLKSHADYSIINVDALTYAANMENMNGIDISRYHFIRGSINNLSLMESLIKEADAIVNFAAETHVDRSIEDPTLFLTTNIIGVQTLLKAALKATTNGDKPKRFVHISTDEVYGSLETDDGLFTENTPLSPNSPYSASKASADLLIRAFHKTYGFPVIIVRPSNNYGPYQFPEKFIPLMITNILENKKIPVYGTGSNVRDWLFVEDNARAIDTILHSGKDGSVYNVGGESEYRNLEIVRIVLNIMGKDESLIQYVNDRPGHDYRYALSNEKIRGEAAFSPSVTIHEGLERTIRWYIDNRRWWEPLKSRLVSESKGYWG